MLYINNILFVLYIESLKLLNISEILIRISQLGSSVTESGQNGLLHCEDTVKIE